MFVLQIIAGPYKDQAVRLEHDRPLTIGRSPSCNIRLDDRHMSSAHAEVSWTSEGFSVFDLSSANGTLVNGHKTSGRTALRLGDHIQTGSTVFLLKDVDLEVESDLEIIEAQGPGGILAFDAGKTEVAMRGLIPVAQTEAFSSKPKARTEPMILGGRADKTTMAAKVASTHLDDAAISDIATLKQRVEAGGNGATVIVQWDDRLDPFWSTPVSIGREHSSGITLEDEAVSLRHAVIDQRDGGFLLRDVGSSNGVYVNRTRVVEHRLIDGDIISIGAHGLVVVLGPGCLGLSVRTPTLTGDLPAKGRALGLVDQPLAKDGSKKKRKKASDLVWYATSDLDRGGFRARAAIVALVFGLGLTTWMLADGDSEVLAGRRLAEHHEAPAFVADAKTRGLDRCTACHVGAGQVSTLKCLDCHPHNRPTDGHVAANLECVGCHLEHQGTDFEASASAVFSCGGCHPNPHEALARTRPQIVAAFDRDTPGDVDFHLVHDAQDVRCLACHAYEAEARPDAIREACGQCHAPDHPAAGDCQICHGGHPDRSTPPRYAEVAPVAPRRFALSGVVWTVGLLVLSFLFAAMIPRRRKVTIETAEADA